MMTDITNFLNNEDNYFILTHHNADPDAIASAVVLKKALKQIGKKSRIGVPESVSEVGRNFLYEDIEIDPEIGSEKIIVVDTSSPEQLEPIKFERANLVIDHHIEGKIKTDISLVEPEKSSCSEMIYEICKKMGAEITPEMAVLLIGGIVYDTAHLRRADRNIFSIITDLMGKADKSYQEILKMLYTEKNISEKIAVLKSMKRIKSYKIGEILVSFTSVGSFEASVARNLLRLGADIAIAGAPKKNKIRISGRMKWELKEKINLAEIFSHIDKTIDGSAGGHDAAASANGKKPENMKKAFDIILKEIEKKLSEKSKEL